MIFGGQRIELKTREQVVHMRAAGLIVAAALEAVADAALPGVTTAELDEIAAGVIADAGAIPAFLGYEGYPATICTSVNNEVIHAIPGPRRLAAGDLLSVDCGAAVDGWFGDSAISVIVPGGVPDRADVELLNVTEAAMWAGIAALAQRGRIGDVGSAVEDVVDAAAATNAAQYGIVEDYVGHGIGTAMHQEPDVWNYRTRSRGAKVRPGMCLAVEPMVTRGGGDVELLDDGWTVVTADGSRAAHWEHTVAVLEDGIAVLTAPDRGAHALARHGVAVVAL